MVIDKSKSLHSTKDSYPDYSLADIVKLSRKTARVGNPSPVVKQFFRSKYIGSRKTVLDFGAGKGRNAKYLKELGFQVVMYDLNPVSTEVVGELPAGIFDIILLNYVLNVVLLKTRLKILEQIRKVTHENSLILIEVRGMGEIKQTIKYSRQTWLPFEDGFLTSIQTFQKGYRKGELQEFLHKHGYKVLKVYANKTRKTSLIAQQGSNLRHFF